MLCFSQHEIDFESLSKSIQPLATWSIQPRNSQSHAVCSGAVWLKFSWIRTQIKYGSSDQRYMPMDLYVELYLFRLHPQDHENRQSDPRSEAWQSWRLYTTGRRQWIKMDCIQRSKSWKFSKLRDYFEGKDWRILQKVIWWRRCSRSRPHHFQQSRIAC